jgi:hypothetical protein
MVFKLVLLDYSPLWTVITIALIQRLCFRASDVTLAYLSSHITSIGTLRSNVLHPRCASAIRFKISFHKIFRSRVALWLFALALRDLLTLSLDSTERYWWLENDPWMNVILFEFPGLCFIFFVLIHLHHRGPVRPGLAPERLTILHGLTLSSQRNHDNVRFNLNLLLIFEECNVKNPENFHSLTFSPLSCP